MGTSTAYEGEHKTEKAMAAHPYPTSARGREWLDRPKPNVARLQCRNMDRRLCKVYPITQLAIESVKFDMQLLENPDVHGIQYQQGTYTDARSVNTS